MMLKRGLKVKSSPPPYELYDIIDSHITPGRWLPASRLAR